MTDPRLTNLAKILVNYSVAVKPKDWTLILGYVESLPLVAETVREVIKAGGYPQVMIDSESLTEIQLRESSQEQLEWVSPIEELAYSKVDKLIHLRAAGNTRALSGIDPARQSLRMVTRRKVLEVFYKRAAEGLVDWTLTMFPCQAYAQDADMSLRDFEDFVYAATYADQPDPIAKWQEVKVRQDRLVEWLKGKRQVVVRGPNADLTLSIAGRGFINACGTKNMPDGEVFTSPVEDSANGWVHYTYPAVHNGREVEGVELEFKDGKVVAARAKKNEEFLLSQLNMDEGARYLGEFAIGTNYGIQKFTRSILYDEKIGGSMHMAVGFGFPEIGGKNVSALHWDFICDMRDNSEILVDGELFYKNGEFVIR